MAEPNKVALVLSAGAPHSPLMAGWLCALLEKGKAFEIIHASGAGAFIGLLYVAPRDRRRDEPGVRYPTEQAREALRNLVDVLGVADPIYSLLSAVGFPVGYKTFFKPGPFTPLFQRWGRLFKLGEPGESLLAPIATPVTALGQAYNTWVEALRKSDDTRRLWNDLVDFWVAALTPTLITPFSKGVCAPLPFLEDLVDFGRLQDFQGHFCMNAYNVSDGKDHMEMFEKTEITPDHVRAALAYPFIYPPGQIKDKLYFEGAERDPIWFGSIVDSRTGRPRWDIRTVVLVDILGELEECLIRPPRNLWDAFEMSILTPICALANKEIRHVDEVLRRKYGFEFHRVKFEIPPPQWPHITDWSYSNMREMWRIGYRKGQEFGNTYDTRKILDSLPDAVSLFPSR